MKCRFHRDGDTKNKCTAAALFIFLNSIKWPFFLKFFSNMEYRVLFPLWSFFDKYVWDQCPPFEIPSVLLSLVFQIKEHNCRYERGMEFYRKEANKFTDKWPTILLQALMPSTRVDNFYRGLLKTWKYFPLLFFCKVDLNRSCISFILFFMLEYNFQYNLESPFVLWLDFL